MGTMVARADGQEVEVRREYAPEEAPVEAELLCRELAERKVLFQVVEG